MVERIAEHPINKIDALLPWNVATQLASLRFAALRFVMATPSFIYRQASLQDLWRETHSDRPIPAELGQYTNWQCVCEAQVIGHCTGNYKTGEIIGLSVDSMYRRRGIGKKLLSLVVEAIRAAGTAKIWLSAPSDPALPAFGFYRVVGWAPTGERTGDGEEILEPLHN